MWLFIHEFILFPQQILRRAYYPGPVLGALGDRKGQTFRLLSGVCGLAREMGHNAVKWVRRQEGSDDPGEDGGRARSRGRRGRRRGGLGSEDLLPTAPPATPTEL